MAVWLLACLCAAARAGDTYVLDRVRVPTTPTAAPGVVRLDAGLAQTPIALFAAGPNVELPLREPVGIDVDESAHRLLVTDAGGGVGYVGSSDFGPCNGGCGAVLSIDPATGATTMLAGPGSPGKNRLENPYGVLHRPAHNDVLVADQGTTRIIKVDLATGLQSVFNQTPPGAPYPAGLRAPWSLARDPTNGDVLVANAGVSPTTPGCKASNNNCGLIPGEFAIPVPPACLGNNGYILRLSPDGVQKQLYCDPDFRRPRDVLVNGDGTIFMVDPISYALSPSFTPTSIVGFGSIFQIAPDTGSTQPLAVGGSMATPSGIDFNDAGTSLLIADETMFPFAGPCISGCGGVIGFTPDSGAQTPISTRGPGGSSYVDPIDLAVDHGGRPDPALPVRSVPDFFSNLYRPEGAPASNEETITALPFFPVRGGSSIRIECVSGTCAQRKGSRRKRGKPRPRVIRKVEVPEGARSTVITFQGRHWNMPPLGTGRKPKRNRFRATVSKNGFRGRFWNFSVIPTGDGHLTLNLLDTGCLIPGATAPTESTKRGGRKKRGKARKPGRHTKPGRGKKRARKSGKAKRPKKAIVPTETTVIPCTAG
jgi:hypothetical protein